MALSGRPQKSLYQVGDTIFFLNGTRGDSSEIVKVISRVTDPQDDNTALQENVYFIKGFVKEYSESELFHSMNALMYNVKGDYLMNVYNLMLESGNNDLANMDFAYTNFSGSSFQGCYLPNADFENANFSNVYFNGSNLSGSNMKKTILTGGFLNVVNMQVVDLTDANLSNADFRGTDLTGATLPLSANTKSSFKSVVGDGHWDAETTIWIDGNPIG